jgi:hypothetical protein
MEKDVCRVIMLWIDITVTNITNPFYSRTDARCSLEWQEFRSSLGQSPNPILDCYSISNVTMEQFSSKDVRWYMYVRRFSCRWSLLEGIHVNHRIVNSLIVCHLGLFEWNCCGENVLKAIELFPSSPEDGNKNAQNVGVWWWGIRERRLGTQALNAFTSGIGVERNLTRAAELFTLSADQGDAGAQFSLAWCFFHGVGVIKNETRAVELYSLSAAHKGTHSLKGSLVGATRVESELPRI